MIFKHLLVGGNSFTQDGIGGLPPINGSNGGCSFIDYGDGNPAPPKSWASIVAKQLTVDSLVNTAASSHGNFLIADTLIYLLSSYPYNPTETLVLFNISIPTRLDVPCEFDHPDCSKFIPWTKSLIPYTYLSRRSKAYEEIEKNIGLDTIPRLSWQRIDLLCNWLENQKFQYLFLTTEDYTGDSLFQRLLVNRQERFIKLEPGIGLTEWGAITKLNTENNYHPDTQGRQIIADIVCNRINKL